MRRTGQVFLFAGIWLTLGLIAYVNFQRWDHPPIEVIGTDRVELARARDGHFHIDGHIETKPVRFLIDTGASTVSIADALARRIGLGCQRPSIFQTANGAVKGCLTKVTELGFGPFVLRDITVAILPNLTSEALLGMNALKAVQLVQVGDRLRLSRLQTRAEEPRSGQVFSNSANDR